MAAPGYPQMGQMAPMPMQRPMKRGAPKIVPVIVSAGLAVGVFCGLLFGLGTGDDATAQPAKGTNIKGSGSDTDTAAPSGHLSDPAKGPVGAAQPQPAKPATPPPPQPAAQPPAPKTVKLVVKIEPDTAAKDAKIKVDGKDITGNSIELPADTKSVKVAVTAPGFHSEDKKVDITGDETTLDLTLRARAASTGSTGASSPGFGGASKPTGGTVPTRPPGPDTGTGKGSGSGGKKKKPDNGLIDI